MTNNSKRVHFPERAEDLGIVVCEVINRSDLTEAERKELWLGPTDYEMGKESAKFLGARSLKCGMSKNLDHIFSEKKTAEAQNKLNEWCACEDSFRGLERWCNHSLSEARQNAVFELVMEVLRVYDTSMYEQGSVDDDEVRKISCKSSKVARVFARMIAKADALAIGQDYRGTSSYPSADELDNQSRHVRSTQSTGKSKSSKYRHEAKSSKTSASSPPNEGDTVKRIGGSKSKRGSGLFGLGKSRTR